VGVVMMKQTCSVLVRALIGSRFSCRKGSGISKKMRFSSEGVALMRPGRVQIPDHEIVITSEHWHVSRSEGWQVSRLFDRSIASPLAR